MTLFDTSLTPTVAPDSIPDISQELESLKNSSLDDITSQLVQSLVKFAFNLAIAIIVFYIGRFIINKIYTIVRTIMLRRKVDLSLITFTLSLVKMLLYFILIVSVIGILGLETSSFLAIFASAGVAMGMALSGTLQNFAGGVLILLIKPYKVGDYIEAQGFSGTVTEIQIFHTIICTPDNKSIIIPNGSLSTGSINNWSREDYRRVDWEIGISYGDDVKVARNAILKILNEDPRIVKNYLEDDRILRKSASYNQENENNSEDDCTDDEKQPWLVRIFSGHRSNVKKHLNDWKESQKEKTNSMIPRIERKPTVTVKELADSSVNLIIRAWTESSNYWSVLYDIYERLYTELPAAGVNFPFPQMDVHVKQDN